MRECIHARVQKLSCREYGEPSANKSPRIHYKTTNAPSALKNPVAAIAIAWPRERCPATPPLFWVAVVVPLAVMALGVVVGADGVKTAGLLKQVVSCDVIVALSVGAEL